MVLESVGIGVNRQLFRPGHGPALGMEILGQMLVLNSWSHFAGGGGRMGGNWPKDCLLVKSSICWVFMVTLWSHVASFPRSFQSIFLPLLESIKRLHPHFLFFYLFILFYYFYFLWNWGGWSWRHDEKQMVRDRRSLLNLFQRSLILD